METAEIICEKRGAAGFITLNRPHALNALTTGMVRGLSHALDEWEHDPFVTRVIITGAGGKAFCAGGDIRTLTGQGRAGRHDEALTFWREEYLLIARIKHYPKPYIALIDGIVMGGGAGVSMHGAHRIAGERYVFAMPEVSIGFFPDVGASYSLPRLPGRLGTYLALTGNQLRQAEGVASGLATAALRSADMATLQERLIAGEEIDAAIAALKIDPGPGELAAHRAEIDACFAGNSVEAILARLDAEAARGSPFAEKTAATIRAKSPTSLALALEQMCRGAALSFAEAMRMDYRIVSRICRGHDFYEGVRAVIVDKDHRPQWAPATLAELDPAVIAGHFAPLGPDELPLEG